MNVYLLSTVAPTTLLNAAAATGAGAEFAVPVIPAGGLASNFTWQTVVTGSPASISTTLEGSNDGTNWTVLDTSTATTGEVRSIANTPVAFIRANLGTLTGGTSPKVSVIVQVGR